jgi:hypothetical protein
LLKLFQRQVLLQLNIAHYLPSIPVLLIIGHFEKLLDKQLGNTASMAVRLTAGEQLIQGQPATRCNAIGLPSLDTAALSADLQEEI